MTLTPGQALSVDKRAQVCDVCDGSGDDPESGDDCHLCEGSGWFDADGFPLSEDEEPTA
jgi:DnaJ-class molecular chaperone